MDEKLVASQEEEGPMEGVTDSGPAWFLNQTYALVDNPDTNNIVCWESTGNSFVILDVDAFAEVILPRYFKHRNFSTFTRQLSICGFRKVDRDRWEFANEGFRRSQRELLKTIDGGRPSSSQEGQVPSACLEVEVEQFRLFNELKAQDSGTERLVDKDDILLANVARLRQARRARQATGRPIEASDQTPNRPRQEFPSYSPHTEIEFGVHDEMHRRQRDEEILIANMVKLRQELQATGTTFNPNLETAPYRPPDTEISDVNMENLENRGSNPSLRSGQDPQMRRSMTMPDTHNHGLSGGRHHHPERARESATTTATSGTAIGGARLIAASGTGIGGARATTTTASGTGIGGATEAYQRPGFSSANSDLEAGGAARGAAPAQQQSGEDARTHRDVLNQVLATSITGSVMAYPVLKDAPKPVKIITFGGLVVIIAIILFVGILSRSLAGRRLAFWLVSYSAVGLLTFIVASQL